MNKNLPYFFSLDFFSGMKYKVDTITINKRRKEIEMHSRIYVLDNKINNVDTYFDDMDFMDYVQESEDSFEEDMNWIGFKQNQVITKEIAQEYWDDKFEMIKDTELNLKNRYKLKTSLDDNHGFHVVVDGICYSLDELMADIAQGYMKEVTFNVVQILDYHF